MKLAQKCGAGFLLLCVIFGLLAWHASTTIQNKKDDPTCSCSKVKDTQTTCIVISAVTGIIGIGLCVWGRKNKSGSGNGESEIEMVNRQAEDEV